MLCYVIYKTMCIIVKQFNLCITFNHTSLIWNNVKCIHSIRFFLYYDATNQSLQQNIWLIVRWRREGISWSGQRRTEFNRRSINVLHKYYHFGIGILGNICTDKKKKYNRWNYWYSSNTDENVSWVHVIKQRDKWIISKVANSYMGRWRSPVFCFVQW